MDTVLDCMDQVDVDPDIWEDLDQAMHYIHAGYYDIRVAHERDFREQDILVLPIQADHIDYDSTFYLDYRRQLDEESESDNTHYIETAVQHLERFCPASPSS